MNDYLVTVLHEVHCHVKLTSCVEGLFFMDVSIQPMSPCIWEDAYVARL